MKLPVFSESRLYGTAVPLYSSTSGNCCGEDPVEELLVAALATPTRDPLRMAESVEVSEIAEFGGGGGRWVRKPPPLAPARAATDDGAIVVSTAAAVAAEPAMRCSHAAAQMSSRKRRRMAPVTKPGGAAWGAAWE